MVIFLFPVEIELLFHDKGYVEYILILSCPVIKTNGDYKV